MAAIPRKLAINCPDNCSLRPSVIGLDKANRLKAVAETGVGRDLFIRAVTPILGKAPAGGTASRHLRHYVEISEEPMAPEGGAKPSDIEILDSIIVSGFRNSKNWKPSIRDTLEAMKLKTQMTGNSAFDDLIALFDVDDEDEDEEMAPEAPEAVFSADELPTDDSEDLEEPLAGE